MGFAVGVVGGALSLATQTYRGFNESGVSGAFAGLGRGAVGTVSLVIRILNGICFLYHKKWFSFPPKMFLADQNYFSSIKYIYRSKVCIVKHKYFSQLKISFLDQNFSLLIQ